jgi:hypothetical protein
MSTNPTGSDCSQAGAGLFKGWPGPVRTVLPSDPHSQYVRRSDPKALFLTIVTKV